MVFFIIFFLVWKSVYATAGTAEIASYSLKSTVTYYLITSFIYRIEVTDSLYLGEDIWNGFFTNMLVRPWNVIASYLLSTAADVLLSLIIFAPFLALIVIFAHDYLLITSVANIVFFVITIIIGFAMNLLINLIIQSLTFYFGDQRANKGLANWIISMIGGGLFPLAFLPAALKWINVLPARFLFDFPSRVFLGKFTITELFSSWAQMIIWILILYFIFYLVYRGGLKRYTGVGR
jgi:ABC-type uncharacterized transport system permease subunit